MDTQSSLDVDAAFRDWLVRFGQAIADTDTVIAMFSEDGHWRDILALTRRYQTFSGREAIKRALANGLLRLCPRQPRVAEERTPPRLIRRSARTVIEPYFDFDTDLGRGTGFVRLLVDGDRLADQPIWILLTAMLRDFPERIGDARPTGLEHSTEFGGQNWADRRLEEQRYRDREPEVLVVGAGQSGLALAARLGQIGVDTLLIEQTSRVGDVWRNRYHSLTLHNETWANTLPYLPFPHRFPHEVLAAGRRLLHQRGLLGPDRGLQIKADLEGITPSTAEARD